MTKEWIPNINIGQDYDSTYKDALVHFDKLGKLADFFGRDMPMHLHSDYCQIHYVQTGKTFFNIDQNTYETQGPALFFTPAATPHAFWTEPDSPGYVITLHSSVLDTILAPLKVRNDMAYLPIVIESEQHDATVFESLERLFNVLKAEWSDASPLQMAAIHSVLQLLIIHLIRLADAQQPRQQHNHAEIQTFRKFSRLLESHFIQERRITFYCDALSINESRLNYICKKVTTLSPKQIINGRIVLEAKRLLAHTDRNLTEIAYTLGFMDPSYFSRFFMKNTGATPTDYRAERQTH